MSRSTRASTHPCRRRRPGARALRLAGKGAVLWLLGLAPAALAAPGVELRHQITPGTVSIYTVRIESLRRSEGKAIVSIQTGRLTREIFREEEAGEASCVQMLELDAPAPDSAPAAPAPAQSQPGSAAAPAAWVHFSITRVRDDHAPLMVPARTAWSRHVGSTVVDVTDWPEREVSVGDVWERAFQAGSIQARQHVRVEALDRSSGDTRATLTVTSEVAPAAASSNRHLVSAASQVVWSVGDRELLSLDGRAVWREADQTGGEVATRILVTRDRRHRIGDALQSIERQAVLELAQAVAACRREDYEDASRTLDAFVQKRPRSRWRPAAEHLREQVRDERASREPLPTDELKQVITRWLALWDQAEQDDDVETLNACRVVLSRLAEVNRPEITRLLDDREAVFRGLACFALAFGTAPANAALLLEACGDADVRVRRTALYALAIRALPVSDATCLLKSLDDADATVRQRACDALGACVSDDAVHLSAARAGLVERLADDSSAVILAAARALIRIGSPDEIQRIARAADHADSETLKQALQSILGRTQGSDTAPSP